MRTFLEIRIDQQINFFKHYFLKLVELVKER